MRHVVNAMTKFVAEDPQSTASGFISIANTEDVKGVAPIVSFVVQSDPIGEVGVNGVQALDMLRYTKCLFQSLNEVFPCKENACTITKIEEAIHWQEARTRDRQRRNVEGTNQK